MLEQVVYTLLVFTLFAYLFSEDAQTSTEMPLEEPGSHLESEGGTFHPEETNTSYRPQNEGLASWHYEEGEFEDYTPEELEALLSDEPEPPNAELAEAAQHYVDVIESPYYSMTIRELKSVASALKIKGYGDMTKAQLVAAIGV
jgi:hypothetical protein